MSFAAEISAAENTAAAQAEKMKSVDDCSGTLVPYQVWDFPTNNLRWAICAAEVADQKPNFSDLKSEKLLSGGSFDHAIESNRRGLMLMKQIGADAKSSYKDLVDAADFFKHASSLGLAEAYSNLALNQFVLTNMEASLKAAEIGALLNQPEAMGLLAFYKIEAIYTDRDLALAYKLTKNAETLGADLSYIQELDVSYQFFKMHWAEVQKSLKEAGFFTGDINGVFGEDAKVSLTAYQLSNGLQVTKKINLELLDELGILARFNEHVEAQQYIYGDF